MLEYLSVQEAARILSVSSASVRLMTAKGTLRCAARTEGGVRLYRRAEVEALAARRQASQKAREGR